jgi:uncharacterized protein YndB with AHSA1/START domain
MKMADAPKRDLVFTRVFDAPVELVWRTWTEAELVMQWWGPDLFTCPSAVMDVREGGTSIVCMRAPEEFGGQDMYSVWAYTKIEPLQTIEYIHNLADQNGNVVDPTSLGLPPEFPRDQRCLIQFKALGSGKTELTVTEFGWTEGPMLKMSETGMNQSLDKMMASLAKSLEGLRPSSPNRP